MANSKRKAHCNKRPYHTLVAAQIGLKRTLTAKNKKGDPIVTLMSAYKCQYCPAFHVGRDRTRGINLGCAGESRAQTQGPLRRG